MKPARRRVLTSIAGSVAAVLTTGAGLFQSSNGSAVRNVQIDPEWGVQIGRRYLESNHIIGGSGSTLSRNHLSDFVALKERIRQDFEEQNVVYLDGWVLSRTECEYCAVKYLIRIQT